MRTRPIFNDWSAAIEIEFEDSIVDASNVIEWVQTAGTSVGVGDWRPQNGRFTATVITDSKRAKAPLAELVSE